MSQTPKSQKKKARAAPVLDLVTQEILDQVSAIIFDGERMSSQYLITGDRQLAERISARLLGAASILHRLPKFRDSSAIQ